MRTWTKQEIVELLKTNRRAVERALVAIYHRQTQDEKALGSTRHHNGIGFAGPDAFIFSSFAKRVMAGYSLSEKQMAVCMKPMKNGNPRIAKYAGQLVEIANAKA